MARRVQAADGHDVVAANDGVRHAAQAVDDLAQAPSAAGVIVVAADDDGGGQAQREQPVQHAGLAFLRHGRVAGAVDDGELAVTRLGQARHEQARRFPLIAQHGVHGVLAGAAVEQHQRHVAPAKLKHLLVRQAGGHDGAIDLVLPHIAQDFADVGFALQGKQ